MRRISMWALSTLASLVLLFSYHTSTEGVQAPGSALAVDDEYAGGTSAGSGTSAPGGAATATTLVSGDLVETRWGPIQVAIEVSDGRLTGVSVPVHPDGSSRNEQINGYALPILVGETLDVQSAEVDMVSGATVTSVGYVRSLQSALDEAGL